MSSHQNAVSTLQDIYSVFKIKSNIYIITRRCTIFLLIYFNSKPLHVSSRLAAHHQEDQLCLNSNWYSHALC